MGGRGVLAAGWYSSHTVNIWGHAQGHISLFMVDYRCCDQQLRGKCSIFRNNDGAIEPFYYVIAERNTSILMFNYINFKFVFDLHVKAPAPVSGLPCQGGWIAAQLLLLYPNVLTHASTSFNINNFANIVRLHFKTIPSILWKSDIRIIYESLLPLIDF